MSIILGHRGASGYAPENTLEAFRLAMDMGADGFELDVHLSKDGELIVMHDERVDRTTDGSGLIQSFTLKELKALDASNGMAKYKGAKVPTLGELYDLIRDTRHVVNVEIKTDQIVYPGIAEKVLKLEQEKIKPDVKYGILYSDGLYEPWKYAKSIGARYIHPHWRTLLYPGLIEGSLAAGIGINPWTVNDEEIMALCIRHGIGVITNYPDKALAIRDRK